MMYRVLCCGDRDWTDLEAIKIRLLGLGAENIEVVIEGEAPGADRLSRNAALEIGIPNERILRFPADWNKFGKAAGPIRNRQQFKEGKPNVVLAFHSNIAKSIGTKDMIEVANKGGVPVMLFAK